MIDERVKMKLHLVEQVESGNWSYRPLSENDAVILAQLMLDAYRGTVDTNGTETLSDALKEVSATLAGTYGPVITSCSFLVERDEKALSAIIITAWTGTPQPFLAFTMTHPAAKNQGLSSFLIKKSINALLKQGYTDLYLFVTATNSPARHLYEKLGFEIVSQ